MEGEVLDVEGQPRLLVTLQDLELAIQRLEDAIAAKPLELEALTRTRDAGQATLILRRKELEDLDKNRRRLESEITQEQYHLQRAQRKLLEIKTNKEYTAMLSEIETVKRQISAHEDTVLQFMELAETRKGELQALEGQLEQEELGLVEARRRNETQLAVLQESLAEKRDRREEAMRQVDRPLLELYLRLLSARKGLAVVGIKNGACQGCFLNIPPQLVQEVRRNDRVLTCSHCHRILYWAAEAHQPSPESGAPELVR